MIKTVCSLLATVLFLSGCATLTTASHFSKDGPMVYSGTRLDIRASEQDENALRVYKDKYGVEPPAHPAIDLPFSFLFDTIILGPIVLPFVLYNAAFGQ